MNNELSDLLFSSARASACFALTCLEPVGDHLRAKSSFVTPQGEVMHWHEFGDLEGPGWAANAVGGAHLLYQWGVFLDDASIQRKALMLLDHILEDGFIDPHSGLIYPYYDLADEHFCWNYTHQDNWLCPGSLARIAVQLLEFSDDLGGNPRARDMQQAALKLGEWLAENLPLLQNGWLPRRITLEGNAYRFTPDGKPDAIFEDSADGLFTLQLWSQLTSRRMGDFQGLVEKVGQAYVDAGGFFGSINHDTYDHHESVAYAAAFRILRQAGRSLQKPGWIEFAYRIALPGLKDFKMERDYNGVPTAGLLWMEKSWKTAYMWENAEAGLAYLEAWIDRGEGVDLQTGLDILQAIAIHHHGDRGFLTEGVDWDNHVTRRHHINNDLYGDIRYTEPLLNNLHHLAPVLVYLKSIGYIPPASIDDLAAIDLVNTRRNLSQPARSGSQGARYLVRFYFPALETETRLLQALAFTQQSGADGVLLFEASYDMDPALLTIGKLHERFHRLKEIVPRFRQIVSEVHINVMITMGHVDAGSGRPERFDFQFMVDEFGQVSRSTACPLDPAYLQYASTIYRMAAECGADAVWVDDDTRFLIHDLPGMTCFCPSHLEAMRKRTGRPWTRPEMVDALKNDLTPPSIRSHWFDVQEEAILNLAQTIRNAVDSVDPGIQIGLMTVGQSFHAAEGRRTDRLLRTLSGSHVPMIRPGSGFWHDERPLGVFDKADGCGRELSFTGREVRTVAEVENHPYTPYGKSERVLKLELSLDILYGMPDLSLNLLSSMAGSGPLVPDGSDHAALLVRQRPFLNALARARAGMLRQGIGIADHVDYARHTPVRQKALFDWVQKRPWESLLARLGFPLGESEQAPHWLSGDVIYALSDYDLTWYLREGVVLDPQAALGLIKRGWGKKLGLEAVIPVNDAVNEWLTNDPINGRFSGYMLPAYNHIPADQLFSYQIAQGHERALARWVNVDGQDCGLALVLLQSGEIVYSAHYHWRVALLPYSLDAPSQVLLNQAHRESWAAMLAQVSGRALPCRVLEGTNLYPMVFRSPENDRCLVAVINLSADDAHQVLLELSALEGRDWMIEKLARDGSWRKIPGIEGSHYRLNVSAFSITVLQFLKNR